MLRGPDTLEIALDHDGQPRGQCLRLLHRVRSEDDGRFLPLSGYFRDDLPHEPSRLRVHTRGGLIQEDDFGTADHGYRH